MAASTTCFNRKCTFWKEGAVLLYDTLAAGLLQQLALLPACL
jgi:hypothetical protein